VKVVHVTLQPGKRCENPGCGNPLPEGVSYMVTVDGELREVCQACFDAWIERIKSSKKHGRRS
jgi:hypothetical protein